MWNQSVIRIVSQIYQLIKYNFYYSQFTGSDETNSFPVSGTEVNIVTSDGNHDLGSSKLKIKYIVSFG